MFKNTGEILGYDCLTKSRYYMWSTEGRKRFIRSCKQSRKSRICISHRSCAFYLSPFCIVCRDVSYPFYLACSSWLASNYKHLQCQQLCELGWVKYCECSVCVHSVDCYKSAAMTHHQIKGMIMKFKNIPFPVPPSQPLDKAIKNQCT